MEVIQYPKLDPEKWANAKLTIIQRNEVNDYVNKHGYTIQRVADMYNVSRMTVKYWSDPIYKANDIARANTNKTRRMQNPAYRKKTTERRALKLRGRIINEPEFKEWFEYKIHYNTKQNQTPERREKYLLSMKTYYQNNVENSKNRGRRSYRVKDNNGFRLFWKHIQSKND